jgi:radical SAM superfamily enzyme YgiQ (UPF0313 family)
MLNNKTKKIFSTRMQIRRYLSQKLKFSLVSLDWIRQKDPPMSLGHASILAAMKQNKLINENVILSSFDININGNDSLRNQIHFNEFCDEITLKVVKTQPDLIAIGVFIWNEIFVQRLLMSLRKKFNYKNKILLGGPQITYARVSTLEHYYPTVDYFIRGYAEDTLTKTVLSLCLDKKIELTNIAGLHLANTTDMGIQSKTTLENLPSPFLNELIDLKHRSFVRWESQRGCPFRCIFCQHRDSYSSRQNMSSDRIKTEIELISKSNVNDIAVLDPTFNSGNKYLSVLDNFIHNKFKGKIALQTRLEMINDDFLDRVNTLNDLGSCVVLECGIQTIIGQEMKIIKRLNNLKRIETVTKKLNERNINFEISVIFGLPKQTLDSFKATLDYCLNTLKPKKVDAWPLMILRGTELELVKDKFDLNEEIISLNNLDVNLTKERLFEGIPHVTSSCTFTKNDWLEMLQISQSLNK